MVRIATALLTMHMLCAISACAQLPEERFATIDGVEIAYRAQGEGEPILLIPNVIGDSFIDMMKEPVLDDYYLVQFHLAGQGHSGDYDGPGGALLQARFAAGLLNHLDIPRAHIVGHSGGADVAMGLALTNPELVQSLVLLEGGFIQYDGFRFGAALAEYQDEIRNTPKFEAVLPLIQGSDDRPRDEQVQTFMTWLADDPNWEELLQPSIPDVREQAMRAVPGGRQRDQDQPDRPQRSDYADISQPTVWVWSDERVGRLVVGHHQLEELIPHMETEHISGVKHGLQIIAPGPVAAVVAAFVERNSIN